MAFSRLGRLTYIDVPLRRQDMELTRFLARQSINIRRIGDILQRLQTYSRGPAPSDTSYRLRLPVPRRINPFIEDWTIQRV